MPPADRPTCPHCHAPIPGRPGERHTCPACGRPLPVPGPSAPGPSRLAGSADDRAVTLPPARSDASTLMAQSAAGPASVEAALREADTEAGRYVEQGILGRGGMGEVALCVERNTRRQVALKRILPHAAQDPSRRARFVEEGQVTAQLQHPNIVPVYELDRDAEGTIYFTMKPVRGRSLTEILNALKSPPAGSHTCGRVPTPQAPSRSHPPAGGGTCGREEHTPQASSRSSVGAGPRARPRDEEGQAQGPAPTGLGDLLGIFLKVCDGVAFAHSRGVVHRDLKPSNLMVGDFGEVLVMDWGLAKIVGREDIAAGDLVTSSRADSDAVHTMDGSALGTPFYMSPEQANGQLDRIDHRSDIYSLGAILYEILTLEKPVEGSTPMVVLAHAAEGNILPPEQRTPHRAIPRELSAIAMKCLAKLRSRRYQSVPDLQSDIRLYLEGRSVTAAPDSFAQAAWKLVKRNRRVSAAVATAAVVLIAVTAFFLLRLKRERDDAVSARKTAESERTAAQQARDRQRATALAASKSAAMEAVRAAEQGRFAEAHFRADAALKVMPDSPWGHYALATIANETKELAAAQAHLAKALAADPLHEPSKAMLAQLAALDGRLRQATELLGNLDKVADWRRLLAAGRVFLSTERYGDATQALGRAVALMEKDSTVLPDRLQEARTWLGAARAELAQVQQLGA